MSTKVQLKRELEEAKKKMAESQQKMDDLKASLAERKMAIKMAARADGCSHCGKKGVALKLCARCKQASYCGAECQKAAWKSSHKKKCALPMDVVYKEMNAAGLADDWAGVLKWEGRMEEMMELQPDDWCLKVLDNFIGAHRQGREACTGKKEHGISVIGLEKRRVEILGKLERFQKQGELLFSIAQYHLVVCEHAEATIYLSRSQAVGAEHGFVSIQCQAGAGLSLISMLEGRDAEGMEQLRISRLAAAGLVEEVHSERLVALRGVIAVQFTSKAISLQRCLQLLFRFQLLQPPSKTSVPALEHVWEQVLAAHGGSDWRGVLKWEGRLDELMEWTSSAFVSVWRHSACDFILQYFIIAYTLGLTTTGRPELLVGMSSLQKRHAELLGEMSRFRDQGEALCDAADSLSLSGEMAQGGEYFRRARAIGVEHGFFSVEGRACEGLGKP